MVAEGKRASIGWNFRNPFCSSILNTKSRVEGVGRTVKLPRQSPMANALKASHLPGSAAWKKKKQKTERTKSPHENGHP